MLYDRCARYDKFNHSTAAKLTRPAGVTGDAPLTAPDPTTCRPVYLGTNKMNEVADQLSAMLATHTSPLVDEPTKRRKLEWGFTASESEPLLRAHIPRILEVYIREGQVPLPAYRWEITSRGLFQTCEPVLQLRNQGAMPWHAWGLQ